MSEYSDKFKQITSTQSVDDQTKTFLRAFVGDFQGKFEEILDLAEDFKAFSAKTEGWNGRELDEFQAHRFLEKRGETKTVKDLRESLKVMDLDSNKKMAFIEFLLFKYKKSLKDLFTAAPNEALVAKLEKAIDQYRSVFEERKKKQEEIADLERIVAQGGPGAAKAKAELKRLQGANPADDAKNEMNALHAKLAAKRALANPEEEQKRLWEEEQKKLAEEQKRKEDEEKKSKAASRAKMKEKASLWS